MAPDEWWKRTVVYQIYPRSFYDSNGDGIGDLPGIIEKLDYLHDRGIETVWISPFFKSPQKDFGYDISDYRDTAPEYGTMADVDRLIQELHDREMKLVLDMVMNFPFVVFEWFVFSFPEHGIDNKTYKEEQHACKENFLFDME